MSRRLVAILAADIVDYSASIGADEQGTLRALKGHASALEPIAGLNGGRIVKWMGDGFLAEFASTVDAVACAESMQRHVGERNASARKNHDIELKFRMAVHAGDVVADGDDIFGDDVNIAARLEGLAEPGGMVISERVHEDVAGKLDIAFEPLGAKTLKNIARPVHAYSVSIDCTTPVSHERILEHPNKPSVAVLAFDNLSSDPEQDYFADGITEDIITELARVPWVFVIARNSTFAYKGQSVDVRRIGRELGVRYILEGSVRKAGLRLRITCQLVDTETGSHVWAERYDASVEDVFELQDRITRAVVAEIAPKIRTAEIGRATRKRPDRLDAYDHYLQAQSDIANFRFQSADTHLERAQALSPNYADAKALRSWIRTLLWNPDTRPTEERYVFALQLAEEVLATPGADIEAEAYAGYTLAFIGGEAERGLSYIENAIERCPSCVSAWGSSCLVHALRGDAETALKHAAQANRLNPADPLSYRVHMGCCLAHIATGNFEELLAVTQRVRAFHNAVPIFRLNEIVAEMALGNRDRACELSVLYMNREPDFSISLFRAMRERLKLAQPGLYEKYYALLRDAGFPE